MIVWERLNKHTKLLNIYPSSKSRLSLFHVLGVFLLVLQDKPAPSSATVNKMKFNWNISHCLIKKRLPSSKSTECIVLREEFYRFTKSKMTGNDPNTETFQTSSGVRGGENKSIYSLPRLYPAHIQAQTWRDGQ